MELTHRYIIWDPKEGEPWRGQDGEFLTSGCLGAMTADSVYLRVYAMWPEGWSWDDLVKLEVGGRISGVTYNLSGSRGTYDIYRVS